MDLFSQLLSENPAATAFGVAGLTCQLTWSLFRARRAIMVAQFGIGADYSIQYALLDAWSGAGVAGLGAMQSAIAIVAGDRPWFSKIGYVLLPSVATICIATWCGAASLCALAAVSLIMMGRLQKDTLRLRMFLLAAAPFGMGYDVLVGALPALIGGITSAGVAALMLMRELHERDVRPFGIRVPGFSSSRVVSTS